MASEEQIEFAVKIWLFSYEIAASRRINADRQRGLMKICAPNKKQWFLKKQIALKNRWEILSENLVVIQCVHFVGLPNLGN